MVRRVSVVGHERRRGDGADLLGLRASRVEVAAGRRVDRRGHVTGEDDPLAPVGEVRVRDRGRGQQRGGVGVAGMGVKLRCVGEFDDPPQVHDRDPVTDVLDHRQVVGDEHVGEAELALEVGEQVEDLRLDGNVQGGHRLVADDQCRLQGECPRDPDPLPLPAGEVGGEPVVVLGVEPDQLHQLLHPAFAFGAVGDPVDGEGIPDDRAHAAAGIECAVRVLEDHLNLPPHGAQLPTGEIGDVAAVELDGAGGQRVAAG